jgi:hypothetical protein
MKKSIVFLALSLYVLIFFSCEFSIPTAIEIIGTPSVRFVEKVDIGTMFTDLLDEAFSTEGRISVFPCKEPDDITYLIHAELFDGVFDMQTVYDTLGLPGIELAPTDFYVVLLSNVTFIDTSAVPDDERMILPFSSIGSLLKGFEFSDLKIKLYVSGSNIVFSKAVVDISYIELEDGVEVPGSSGTLSGLSIDNEKSNIDVWKTNGYDGKSCPDGGTELDIPITGKDMVVSFRVYFPKDEYLTLSDFQNGNIKVETVIWFPLKLKAVVAGAEIAFPEDSFFSSEDDLFTREAPDEDNLFLDIIESLSVNVKFQKNPFMNADLIIESKGIEIHNRITDNSISFTVSEDDMRKINNPENFPFTPNLRISFPLGATLSFPKVFIATEFGLTAKIRYRIDLQ